MTTALLFDCELEAGLTSHDDAAVPGAAPATSPVSAARPFQLHTETCYILDCSVELGEITPLEDLVFRVQNPAAFALMERMDRDEMMPPHWLRNTARQYLDSLPLEDRYVWMLRSLPGMEFGVRMLQERIEFMVQAKVQSDLGIDERTSVRFMDEGTPDVFADKQFKSVHDVTQARVQQFVAAQYSDAIARLEADVQLAHEALAWSVQPGNKERARAVAKRLFKDVPHAAPDQAMGTFTPGQLAKYGAAHQRKTQRRARSAIKKALNLFRRTGQEGNVRLLVSGQEVELAHPDSPFKFVLQPLQAGWLEQKTVAPGGHVPYQLTLLTKEGVFLSRLCVLFDETPVLDQLLALTLFVESGCEEEILAQANWFGYAHTDTVRAILEEKAPALLHKVPEQKGCGGTRTNISGILDFNRTQAHWEPFKGPVRNWITTWMGGLYAALPRPGSSMPALT